MKDSACNLCHSRTENRHGHPSTSPHVEHHIRGGPTPMMTVMPKKRRKMEEAEEDYDDDDDDCYYDHAIIVTISYY